MGKFLPHIVLEIEISMRCDCVFAAWTDTRLLEKWFVTEGEFEARLEGEFVFWFIDWRLTEKQLKRYGEVLDFKVNEMLRLSWCGTIRGKIFKTEVEIVFEEKSQTVTILKLRHHGWGTNQSKLRAQHLLAWKFYLDNLKQFLENGKDHRKDILGQLVKRRHVVEHR